MSCSLHSAVGRQLVNIEIFLDVRLFACWCGKAFKRKSHLTGHQQTHGARLDLNTKLDGELEAGAKYHCDICSRSYPTKSALERDMQWHVRAGQATEDKLMEAGGLTKPFKCQEEGCDKTFRVRSELSKHATSHSSKYQIESIEGFDWEEERWGGGNSIESSYDNASKFLIK